LIFPEPKVIDFFAQTNLRMECFGKDYLIIVNSEKNKNIKENVIEKRTD